ncbi:MAG: hypothetical protein LJE59_15910 [Chromatiaceae bacterium]|nr:hypothetical protein [Chromatiaceae bacterium]
MDRRLIAHRGEPLHWPENSLRGFRAVLAAGACYLETDVQITLDRTPVLSHDDSLLKMTGRDLPVTQTRLADVLALPAGQPARFGARFASERIPTLGAFAALLAQWPEARAFVEIKLASIQAFGVEAVVDLILDALDPVRAQCIPISFEYPALQYLRANTGLPLGWVLPGYSDANRMLADRLAPEYLFVNRRHVPRASASLWPGAWRWAAYTANRPAEVERLFTRGFDLVETNDIRRLMHSLKGQTA